MLIQLWKDKKKYTRKGIIQIYNNTEVVKQTKNKKNPYLKISQGDKNFKVKLVKKKKRRLEEKLFCCWV